MPIGRVRMLILDVDGVLTDGTFALDHEGHEHKSFSALDGSGIKYWHRAGMRSAIITGRTSPCVQERAKELGIEDVYLGAYDKLGPYTEIRDRHQVEDEEVCYIGDDLTDLPLLRRVGFPATVPHAPPEVKRIALYVTRALAGKGAVREVIEKILRYQDRWEDIVARYEVP